MSRRAPVRNSHLCESRETSISILFPRFPHLSPSSADLRAVLREICSACGLSSVGERDDPLKSEQPERAGTSGLLGGQLPVRRGLEAFFCRRERLLAFAACCDSRKDWSVGATRGQQCATRPGGTSSERGHRTTGQGCAVAASEGVGPQGSWREWRCGELSSRPEAVAIDLPRNCCDRARPRVPTGEHGSCPSFRRMGSAGGDRVQRVGGGQTSEPGDFGRFRPRPIVSLSREAMGHAGSRAPQKLKLCSALFARHGFPFRSTRLTTVAHRVTAAPPRRRRPRLSSSKPRANR
jgi:hypothetical protein